MYPVLAVAHELIAQRKNGPPPELLYVGSQGGIEESLVAQAGLPLQSIPAGGLRGLAPWKVAANLLRQARGLAAARRIVREFVPHAVLVTGGYVCAPVALAARWRNVPVMIYLPDLEPGLAIRALSRLAVRVAVSFSEAGQFFPESKVLVSGYPVREALLKADKAAAREAFALDQNALTLIVFGGSRGARSINRAVSAALEPLLELCQVIHISGQLDAAQMKARQEGLSPTQRDRYRLYAYLHQEMPLALAAADLAVARAGASTLGEFPILGLPSVLVPYPYAGAHQETNAAFMVRHGAAIRLADAELADRLLPTVRGLLEDRTALARMAQQARALARPDAPARLAQELRRLAQTRTMGG